MTSHTDDSPKPKLKLITEPMSPHDLGELAKRLPKSENTEESNGLVVQITVGF